jgi:hypothetical protein
MYNIFPWQDGFLDFLHDRGATLLTERFVLLDGSTIDIQNYLLYFLPWHGASIRNNYGGKPIVDFNDEPVFAELCGAPTISKRRMAGRMGELIPQ